MQKIKLPRNRKKILVLLAVVLLMGIFTERYITQGTFLGYQVRKVKKSALTTEQTQPSRVCAAVNESQVGEVLGASVKRTATNLGDVTEPVFLSVCSYRTEAAPYRTVTIVLREYPDSTKAASQLVDIKSREGVKKINLADQAYFSVSSRQLLAVGGKRVVSVTVSDATERSTISSEEAAIKFTQRALE